jgi:hypothetical protein
MGAKATKGPVGTPHRRQFKITGGNVGRGIAVIAGSAQDEVAISGAAGLAIGICEEATLQDKQGSVVLHGECIAIAGGVVAQFDWVKADAAGKLVASAGEDTANVGRAMSAAAADTDEFVLFVNPVKKRS